MMVIHTMHVKFLLFPPYAAELNMAINKGIAPKFISGIFSAKIVTIAKVTTRSVIEGKRRRHIRGTIIHAISVTAKKVFTGGGCELQ